MSRHHRSKPAGLPRPPFPYRREEVTCHGQDGARLAGTLTVPPGEDLPAALILGGSGAVDRDGTTRTGQRPFWLLADRLARRGVAALRVDARGVRGSEGHHLDATLEERVADARAGLARLRQTPALAPGRAGVIGFSEGALVAAVVSRGQGRATFCVMVGVPGLPGVQTVLAQKRHALGALGVAAGGAREVLAMQTEALERLAAGEEGEAVKALVIRAAQAELEATPRSTATPAMAEALAHQSLEFFTRRAGRTLLRTRPAELLSRIQVPALALWGGDDVQVPPAEHKPAVEAALAEAGVPWQARVIPKLDHLLQPADDAEDLVTAGGVAAALDTVVDWSTH